MSKNDNLFYFQLYLTTEITKAQVKGLTVVEIIGTFEAIKYKLLQSTLERANKEHIDEPVFEE